MGSESDFASDNFSFQKIIVVLSIVLLIVKFAAWSMTKSVSILTDAIESIVNVVAAFIGLYALYLSAQPRDRNHPYGHGKVELFSSMAEGMMILTAGGLIIFEAVERLIHPAEVGQLDVGLILVAAAAAANFIVGMAAVKRGKKKRSPALEASGKHLCSDTVSSVGIIVGLGAMLILDYFGVKAVWLDGAIAALFGAIIMIGGIRVVKESMDGVMDRADEEAIDKIVCLINRERHDHWVDVHDLRITKYGPSIHADLHVVFPSEMTIREQKQEIDEITEAIKAEYGGNIELTVMGEPCTEDSCRYCALECGYRVHQFTGYVEWDSRTATDGDESHSSKSLDDSA